PVGRAADPRGLGRGGAMRPQHFTVVSDDELDELEGLAPAGTQALAGLATSITLAAACVLATSASDPAFWRGTAWGCGAASVLLWPWWVVLAARRRRLVTELKARRERSGGDRLGRLVPGSRPAHDAERRPGGDRSAEDRAQPREAGESYDARSSGAHAGRGP